jgi:hypothetical protein
MGCSESINLSRLGFRSERYDDGGTASPPADPPPLSADSSPRAARSLGSFPILMFRRLSLLVVPVQMS